MIITAPIPATAPLHLGAKVGAHCVICGAGFKAHGVKKTCSKQCSAELRLQRKRADYIKTRGELPDRQCCVCGAAFRPRINALTCSEACAQTNRRSTAREGHERRYIPAEVRECVICSSVFAPHGKQKTCGDKCSHELERRNENNRRALRRAVSHCVVCGGGFHPRGRQTTCSHKCGKELRRQYEASRDRDIKRELCRDWRRRNPDKQKAATKRWQDNNRERHLEACRVIRGRFWQRHPGLRAALMKIYRASSSRPKAYAAERTAAYRIVRLVEKYGISALEPGFREPVPGESVIKAREASARWKARNPAYKQQKQPREKRIASQKKHAARETAAINLIREIQSKGIEALL